MEEASQARSSAADSTSPSTPSGHAPGTPKPPISPPRRRSSLAFSKVFTCSLSNKDDGCELRSAHNTVSLPRPSPSRISRKALPASVHRQSVPPRHMTRLQQKLLQSAKTALRLDMAFAASPTGSIGARLPPDTLARTSKNMTESSPSASGTPKQAGWRYSVAPNALADLNHDVREPVEGCSLTLPANPPTLALNEDELVGDEPVSSGFSSPVVNQTVTDTDGVDLLPALPSSPPVELSMEPSREPSMEPERKALFGTTQSDTELEEPMTGLKVNSSTEDAECASEESPTVAHLQRVSAEARVSASSEMNEKMPIILSETAEAAAKSARAKRGLLRNIMARRECGNKTTPREQAYDSSGSSKSSEISCPDPALHRLIAGGHCPDPSVHLRHPSPLMLQGGFPITPEAMIGWPHFTPGAMQSGWYPPQPNPCHRATATGSPMPFARARPRRYASQEANIACSRPSTRSNSSAPYREPAPENRPRAEMRKGGGAPVMASEHFQPGWHYARPCSNSSEYIKPMTYSFSTAAAKVGGQSSAPDCRIRDSYRTDTLTPLARPPSRFRKTGIGAMTSWSNVNRYYGGDMWQEGRASSHKGSGRPRPRMTMHDNVQFHSSPPRPVPRMPSSHKRRRPQGFEEERGAMGGQGHNLHLENNQGLMEIDDETRAAVRMSVFGSSVPELLQSDAGGLRELSPNVRTWRKGMRQPAKMRRPSYWDGDLKQVRDSPAGGLREEVGAAGCSDEAMDSASESMVQHGGPERRVCTSPVKAEIENVEGQTGLIGFEGGSVEGGMEEQMDVDH